MGRLPRPRPRRLGEKLLGIREQMGLSQTEMSSELDLQVDYSAVSQYELGTREPPLPVLLRYGRLAGVIVDVLIDDKMELPPHLPVGRAASRSKRREKRR
jgi:transcriptional regulator with XRE-family HTH domain